jgi:polyhydroxybutyrate depolymerase
MWSVVALACGCGESESDLADAGTAVIASDGSPGGTGDASGALEGGGITSTFDGGGQGDRDAAVVAAGDSGSLPAAEGGTGAVDGSPGNVDSSRGAPDAGASSDAGSEPVKSAGCGTSGGPTSHTSTINVGGTERTYILRVPLDYDANRPYRLILSYHPLGGTAQQIASGNYYGLWSMANGSTIFAAPQGIDNAWRDSGRSATSGGQDIAFTKAMIDELTNKLCIDRSRIFAEGFSMGGSMSYAVACAMGDVVRAVVAHSGGPMSGCVRHDKPVAYFMTHGTQDTVCTYPEFGVPQINDFAKVNGCVPREMPTPSASAHACADFSDCMPGYPARACIFVGGHTPSAPGNWVPSESWKFIAQF